MSTEPRWEYFNYFTEIEEHFQRARGSSLFLLSPLDWALVESWKNAGIPLEAVLRGIDAAFERWRSRKSKVRLINSLAYCAQEVLAQAQTMSKAEPRRQTAPPFALEQLRAYLAGNAAAVRPFSSEIADALDSLAAGLEQHYNDLEQLEQQLTVLEEKLIAAARVRQSPEDLLAARRELARQLAPYRGKMSGEQIAMLEKQFLERDLLEKAGLPRLSLFYMR